MISFLSKGDKVAITAISSKVNIDDLQVGIDILENDWQLDVVIGNTVGNSFHNFSDTDENKIAELQQFLDDPSIKLIIAARGGFGVSRILDNLDFTKFKESPKWIVGFSDITILLSHIYQLGFQAIHGPMIKTFSFDLNSNIYLKNMLFGGFVKYNWQYSINNLLGKVSGVCIGGNLCLLTHAIGTKSDIDYSGKILFIEDISEYNYSIDRMLVQLDRAGKLKNLAGLVVGDFSDCKDNSEPFGFDYQEIILSHVSKFNYPVAFNFDFGHEKENYCIKIGEELILEVNESGSNLTSKENYEQI